MLRTDWWLSEEMQLGAGEMGEGHLKYLSVCECTYVSVFMSVLKHYRTQIYYSKNSTSNIPYHSFFVTWLLTCYKSGVFLVLELIHS